MEQIKTPEGFTEWWAVTEDGLLTRWKLEGEDLMARKMQPDGSVQQVTDNRRWQIQDPPVEIARLEKYRATVASNSQLAKADRQAILQTLDQIVSLLKAQNQATLQTALAEPEGALAAMIDRNASLQKEDLRAVATDVTNDLILSVLAYDSLNAPTAAEMKATESVAIARRLDKAAKQVEAFDSTVSGQLQQAAESLRAGNVTVARDTLGNALPTLNQFTGSLGKLIQALAVADYGQAGGVLRNLSDPAKTPLNAPQVTFLPDILEQIAQALKDTCPDLRTELLQAASSLQENDTETARAALGRAAEQLEGIGQTIARSDAAAGARVGRVFWGVDMQNHAVRWEKGAGKETWVLIAGTGWKAASGGPAEYIPLQKGLLRGDPGLSLRTGRPVADLLYTRLRNSLVLAGLAFVIVMPLALLMGILAGLNEGKWLDRALSIGGMMFSVTPEFATGIFLILIFASWLKWAPGATVFGEKAPWTRPDMLVLPVLTLTLVELGYVLRITRASMVEVMKAPYIRTAFLKGLPYWRIVLRHVVRNALMAPITVIMLHINWLLGGIVVVEVIFGYPGLGSYLLDSALFKDFNAIEAGAIVLVAVAVGTQLLADVIYTFLNPRIRYA
jgi:peptide/nickel transport system permease protein